jgi:hypothetical protein
MPIQHDADVPNQRVAEQPAMMITWNSRFFRHSD